MMILRFTLICLILPMLAFIEPAPAPGPGPGSDAPGQAAPAEDAAAKREDQNAGVDLKFLRVVSEPNESLQLEIAVQQFARPDGSGPRVSLVGVSHIGERKLYRNLQGILEKHDIVLYESVKPPGAGGAGGESAKDRIESTQEAMRFLASLIKSHDQDLDRLPKDLNELKEFAARIDSRLGAFVDDAGTDAWARPFVYQLDDESFSLTTLGADGEPGGEDENADIDLADLGPIEPRGESDEDSLQADLARTLNLQFQLDGIDYDHESWRCSDMAMDQVDRAMKEKGSDFEIVSGALAGSSFPARIVKFLLGAIRFADWLTEGAAVEMIKIMIIEMLGDETVLREATRQFGPGFHEVIVEQRNQVVIDDLKRIIDAEPPVKSVAIFYGAAHMPDLARRLADQLGYEPTGETKWMEAIKVDLANSKLTRQEVGQIRMMLRRAIRQQFGPPRKRAAPEPVEPIESPEAE